nr:MBL fold metallo-hydrolase [Desulfovibrio inopinatus]
MKYHYYNNKSLWGSFALETPSRRVFYSGDSGYGGHFAEIGERFGGFDLALLDSGQYSEDWPYVHMMPEQAAQAAKDLRASRPPVSRGQVLHFLPLVE